MEFDANNLKEYIELEMRIAGCEKNRWQEVLDLNAGTIGKLSPMKMVIFTSPPQPTKGTELCIFIGEGTLYQKAEIFRRIILGEVKFRNNVLGLSLHNNKQNF